jgi:uncharacterized protein YdhG (YjbR/CyaY superfamily)
MPARRSFKTVDEYIATFPPGVQDVLEKIRVTIRQTSPKAQEKISYNIPAFVSEKRRIYFAAFKNHIGIYPPVRGDAKLMKDVLQYRGEKGNLKFPFEEKMPYALIKRIAKAMLQAPPQNK